MMHHYKLKLIDLKRCFVEGKFEDNFDIYNENYVSRMDDFAISERSIKEINFIINKISPLNGARVLDFGCNTGRTMNYVSEICQGKMYGVDTNIHGIKAGMNFFPNFDFKTVNSDILPYKDNFFDWVMMNHVIAHVPNPSLTLREINRVLKLGGQLSIVTPNKWYKFFMTPNNLINTYKPDITILRYYTLNSLTKLIKSCGFSIIDKSFFGESSSWLKYVFPKYSRMRLIALAKKQQVP